MIINGEFVHDVAKPIFRNFASAWHKESSDLVKVEMQTGNDSPEVRVIKKEYEEFQDKALID